MKNPGFFGEMESEMWKNVGNFASEEDKTWKNVGHFASQQDKAGATRGKFCIRRGNLEKRGKFLHQKRTNPVKNQDLLVQWGQNVGNLASKEDKSCAKLRIRSRKRAKNVEKRGHFALEENKSCEKPGFSPQKPKILGAMVRNMWEM